MIESSNLQKSFKCSRHRFRRAIKRILPQNQMCKSTGWMTIVWLINPQPSNQLVAQGQIQSVWAALKAVLRLHTSHLQDPSAVRPHLIPYRWPNWPKKDMERAFWRYVIRRPRFPLLLPFRFPGKLELKLGLIEPEWWQQLAWLNAVPWPPGESLSKNIFHRLGNDEFPVKLAQ